MPSQQMHTVLLFLNKLFHICSQGLRRLVGVNPLAIQFLTDVVKVKSVERALTLSASVHKRSVSIYILVIIVILIGIS